MTDFTSDADVIAYVERQLAALTEWQLERASDAELSWRIKRGELEYYELSMSSDRTAFIVSCNNTDAGALTVARCLTWSASFPTDALRLFPLSDVVQHLIEHHEPNRFGLT